MATTTTERKDYIASIDAGTSSVRIIIFDQNGNKITSHSENLTIHAPHSGWSEQDPIEIIYLVSKCMSSILSPTAPVKINKEDIAAVGITNQRETTIVWDGLTGEPLYNAIVWQDTRNTDTVHKLTSQFNNDKNHFRSYCGLPLSTYFSGTKLVWLYDNIPKIKDAIDNKSCKFGTVDSWIMYNLLNGQHLTDVTNASRTMLMNLSTLTWDEYLLSSFKIPKEILPEIVPSSNDFGEINKNGCKLKWNNNNIIFEFDGIDITGCLGDQQAATVGQGCFEKGSAKNTYGTGAFLIYNTGNDIVQSHSGLLTTVLYQFEMEDTKGNDDDNDQNDGKSQDYKVEVKHGSKFLTAYALEGSVAVAGQISRWLQDNLGMVGSPEQTSKYASEVEDTGGVYFVTAFSGLFAPYWRDDVRGIITGLTMHTKREHICRAALEAVCHRTCEVVDAMQQDSGILLQSLRVDGGMSQSDVMLSMQSELVKVPVIRPKMIETTALGAAIAAGLQVGYWKNINDAKNKISQNNSQDIFKPSTDKTIQEKADRRRREWKEAVLKSMSRLDKGDGSIRSEMKALTNTNSSTYTLFPPPGKTNGINGNNNNNTGAGVVGTGHGLGILKVIVGAATVFAVGIAVGLKLKDYLGGGNGNGTDRRK